MKALIYRELKSIFCSPIGVFFALTFLLAEGSLLWFFSGNYNLIDGGYADMGNFFQLTPILLAILIPALTMRSFAEEKYNKTLDILISRPTRALNIYLSKFIALFSFVFIVISATFIYPFSLAQIVYPVGNIDLNAIIVSYLSLYSLSAIFISIGLFCSSITKSQIIALITAIVICLFSFFGFDLISNLFLSGKINTIITSFGLSYHYKLMQRGVIQINDIVTFANYLIIFSFLTTIVFTRLKIRILIIFLISISILNIISNLIPNKRYDFSEDKRYTISDLSINLLKKVDIKDNLSINIYLDGDLNYVFQQLRNETDHLVTTINRYTNSSININYLNPYQNISSVNETYSKMHEMGMDGIILNETDREGKSSMKVIYPYAQLTNGADTLVIPLLKNIPGYSTTENLNASIESLEFEFMDAIKLLLQNESKNIAFIEGHNELSRDNLYDSEVLLSKYYSVNRGQIGKNIDELDTFSAIIIAGPLEKYNETEKYIIDQYIMSGGKVLWLIDGVFYSHEQLSATGQSPSMRNDVNLDDMLFIYGVRVNPDLIQDIQSTFSYLISDDEKQPAISVPNYFQPLLMPSTDHPITKNIKDVKAGFASSIDFVNNSADIKKNVLLTSSQHTHLVNVPDIINFDPEQIQQDQNYFNQAFIPVAVALEGYFPSVYTNRTIPDSVHTLKRERINKSKETKMIIASSSDIISNGIDQNNIIPMGYDLASKQIYGNREFIVNALNWLTDDDGIMELRTKKQRIYALDKKLAYENRDKYTIINLTLPSLFILLLMGGTYIYRKRKYEK